MTTVTGPVHQARSAARIGDEPFFRLHFGSPVPPHHGRATDEQFTFFTLCGVRRVVGHDVRDDPVDGSPDRDVTRAGSGGAGTWYAVQTFVSVGP